MRTKAFMLIFLSAPMFTFAQTDTLKLKEVVVTGTRNAVDVRHLPTTVTVIDREKLTEQQQPSILPTVMQEVPGLFVTSRAMMGYGVSDGAAGGLNLRGISGGAGQLLVLIDGQPQYQGIYGHPIADSYQTLMAERVEVLRGPASVLYGSNAMGGVLNIVTRGMHTNGVRTHINLGAGSWGTLQTEASNQVRAGKFSSTVAVQYNRTDNHRPRMGFQQCGGYLKLGYDFTPHWNANITGNVTHFKASTPGMESSPLYDADQWITRGVASLSVANHYDRTSGALTAYSSFGRHKIDDGTSNPAQPTNRYFRSKDVLAGVSWYQSAQFFAGNRVTLGVDYQHIYGDAYYTSKQTGETMDTPNKQSGTSHRNEVAGYVDFRQDLGSWVTLDAGLRVDHHSVVGTAWIPQFGIATRPTETTEFKMTATKGYRNPTMRELYLYPPSNEELRPESLWNYEVAWKHRLGTRFTYGLNFFYIKGNNMIQNVNRKNINTGVIENCGAELEANYRINSHWTLSTNHSYLHMEHPIIAAPEYKGYLGANVRYGKWNVICGLQCFAGLYTAVGQNEQKECAYLLNATVNYALCRNLRLWARGENLLAQSYEVIQGYPMPRATFMGGVNISF
ncbi:MAG: TonB-dependent receptor [Bacteroidaceae bacterium]|nr:TonB-dependent receptor [Bacteroidaceae bacterium]